MNEKIIALQQVCQLEGELAEVKAENERLKKCLNVPDFVVDGLMAIGQELIKREKTIDALRKALVKYGEHKSMCEIEVYSHNCNCNCGFEQAKGE